MSQATFDPSKRRLCPDGACVGVIGDDGRCRTCGRANDGSAPPAAFGAGTLDSLDDAGADVDADAAADLSSDHDGAAGAETNGARAGAGNGVAGGFRPDRPLCDDGSCVGVIRDDGRCSVCGRAGGG
jgi:hypothetical protein